MSVLANKLNMESPITYNTSLAQNNIKIGIFDYMITFKNAFNPTVNMILYTDLSKYVNRKLEYCIDARYYYKYARILINNPDEFDLNTCDPKCHINIVLNRSNMIINIDYELLDIEIEKSKETGGVKYAKRYMMKPKSFYKLLMDIPDKYRGARQLFNEYHEFLFETIVQYEKYQNELSDVIKAKLQNDNNELVVEVKTQSAKIDAMMAQNDSLQADMRMLIGVNHDQNAKLDYSIELQESLATKMDDMFTFICDLANMMIPMWVGAKVFKSHYDGLLVNKNETYAIKHLKIMIVVGFRNNAKPANRLKNKLGESIIVENELQLYFCCINFNNLRQRLQELRKRHKNQYMLEPAAICLISNEVNLERNIIENLNIIEDKNYLHYLTNHKSFIIGTDIDDEQATIDIYNKIIENTKSQRFQSYQMKMDTLHGTVNDVSKDILDYLKKEDNQFFDLVNPLIQDYLDSYIELDGICDYVNYDCVIPDNTKRNNTPYSVGMISDNLKTLFTIADHIDNYNNVDIFQKMVDDDIIKKDDVETVKEQLKLFKEIARLENIST